MNQAILDKIRKVEPYVPGEQPKERVIKLNTNENPYPPAPGVAKVLKEMDADSFRLYPDPAADILVEELSRFYRVGKEQIFVGVGSDDVLSMCFLTFFNSDKPILFPDITYSFYKVWAQLYRIPYRCPKLDERFCLVKEDYYAENGGIIFPNPNAPTAIYEDLDFIEDILRHNPDSVVIVDEAYIDFAGKSALELIDRYENLLVVQTFSKSRSMAGMRICNRKSGADRISQRCQIFIQLLHNESGGSVLWSAECEGGSIFSRMCRPDRRDKRVGKTRACRAWIYIYRFQSEFSVCHTSGI